MSTPPPDNRFHTFMEVYDAHLAPLLKHRAEGFRTIFRLLEEKKVKNFRIVETGTTRVPNEWEGDGQSTRLFDSFVNFYSGTIYSVDISEEAVEVASSLVSNRVYFHIGDSVRFLYNLSSHDKFDLIYLDSFDVDFENPHPSAMHHIFELLSVLHKNTQPGTLIAIDDHDGGRGKGKYIAQYLDQIGVKKVYEGYQIVYQL